MEESYVKIECNVGGNKVSAVITGKTLAELYVFHGVNGIKEMIEGLCYEVGDLTDEYDLAIINQLKELGEG